MWGGGGGGGEDVVGGNVELFLLLVFRVLFPQSATTEVVEGTADAVLVLVIFVSKVGSIREAKAKRRAPKNKALKQLQLPSSRRVDKT